MSIWQLHTLGIINSLPQDIAAELILHLDAADPSTITQSGGAVSQWSDKSGNNNHFSQATGAEQPIIGTTTMNGLNTIKFDGINDNLDATSDIDFIDKTVLVVVRTTNPFSSYQQIISSSTINNQLRFEVITGFLRIAALSNPWGPGGVSTVGVQVNIPTIVGFIGDIKAKFIINDVFEEVGTNRTNSNPYLLNQIGLRGGGGEPLKGDIAEILIYDGILSTNELDSIRDYLTNKWVEAPKQVSNQQFWYDASDINTITESGGLVSQWDDKSGNDNHVIQATGSRQPITNSTNINGKNAIKFDGVDDYMIYDNLGVTLLNNPSTIFLVFKYDIAPINEAIMDGISVNERQLVLTFSGAKWSIGHNFNAISDGAADQNVTLFTAQFNGLNSKIFINGVQQSTVVSIGDGNLNNIIKGIVLGSSYAIGNHANIRLGEVIGYNGVLSAEDQENIENYLLNKWNPLPVTNNLNLWLDAAESSTITQSGGAVSQWNDKSGNNNHVTQGLGTSQPTTNSVQLNGKNVISFDGLNDYLTGNINGIINNPSLTIFLVMRGDATTATNVEFGLGTNATNQGIGTGINLTSGFNFFQWAGLEYNVLPKNTNWTLVTAVRNNSTNTISLKVNDQIGSQYSGSPAVLNLPANPTVNIGRFPNTSFYHKGEIAEVIVYDQELTTNELDSIRSYLSVKWGILPPTGLQLHLDTSNSSSIEGIASEFGAITQWNDLSGNARHATQTVEASRPTINYNPIFNGKPTIQFNGTQNFDVDLSFMANSSVTTFIVQARNSSASTNYYLGANGTLHLGYRLNTTLRYGQFGNDLDVTVPGFTTQTKEVHTFLFDSTTGHSIYRDNVLATSNVNTSGLTSANSGKIGQGFQTAQKYFGDIAEIIIYNRALSSGEIDFVNRYLLKKWNV